jgi:hypothetical protein
MMSFSSLSKMLGGNLESKEAEKRHCREDGSCLFESLLSLGAESNCCSLPFLDFGNSTPFI